MVKKFIPAIAILVLFGSCSSLKQLSVSNNKPIIPQSTSNVQETPPQKANDVKFLNNISANASSTQKDAIPKPSKESLKENSIVTPPVVEKNEVIENSDKNDEATENNFGAALQTKYGMMLNTDPTRLQNVKLYEYIDNWYGTPYKFGGTTKDGIDCSAFVQSLFAAVYGVALPRTSKYQFTATKRISTTQLKEGDLLFFHTRRYHKGVTHVGIYLQNNKFVQASSSGGVQISDMYEPYYAQHLIGAGRVSSAEK